MSCRSRKFDIGSRSQWPPTTKCSLPSACLRSRLQVRSAALQQGLLAIGCLVAILRVVSIQMEVLAMALVVSNLLVVVCLAEVADECPLAMGCPASILRAVSIQMEALATALVASILLVAVCLAEVADECRRLADST